MASLEAKGYLVRKPNPEDGRSQLLYATEKAEKLKNSKAHIETVFYEWLLSELPGRQKKASVRLLIRSIGSPNGSGRRALQMWRSFWREEEKR